MQHANALSSSSSLSHPSDIGGASLSVSSAADDYDDEDIDEQGDNEEDDGEERHNPKRFFHNLFIFSLSTHR